MIKKNEFSKIFEIKTGTLPETLKDTPKTLAAVLNKFPELKKLFREAVAEAKEASGSGLNLLFPD